MAEKKTCLDAALAFLGRREHAVKELRTKLLRKDYAPAEISQVIEKLIQKNLLSDSRYAAARARYRATISRWGLGRIRQELKLAGVSESDAQVAVCGLSADGIVMEDVAKLSVKGTKRTLLQKLRVITDDPALGLREKMIARQKAHDKLLAKLLRKGFTLAEAKGAIAEADAENPE